MEEIGVDGRIILKWALNKSDGEGWIGLLWVKIETVGGRL